MSSEEGLKLWSLVTDLWGLSDVLAYIRMNWFRFGSVFEMGDPLTVWRYLCVAILGEGDFLC